MKHPASGSGMFRSVRMICICAALLGATLVALPATAEAGRLFTPGPNYLTNVQKLTFKLQNLYRDPVALAVAVLASNGNVSFYQQVTVPAHSVVDVLAPVVCQPCTPVVFLPDGQPWPSHYKLPLMFNIFLDSTTSDVAVSQAPWEVFQVFHGATLTANSIDFGPKFSKDLGCMSWSPGPVRLPVTAGVFIAANWGKEPVNVETGCIDTSGQPGQGCRQTMTIPPLQATLIQLAGLAEMLPFINATPGTLGLDFAVLQFVGPHQSIYQQQFRYTPKDALVANNLSCQWSQVPPA